MAEIALNAKFYQGTLKLATNGYTAHCASARLVPTSRSEVITDIAGVDHVVGGKSLFKLEIDLIQDHSGATSLSRFAFANDGATVAGELTDEAGGKYAFTVVLHAADVGGAFGATGKGKVSAPTTYPVYTAPA